MCRAIVEVEPKCLFDPYSIHIVTHGRKKITFERIQRYIREQADYNCKRAIYVHSHLERPNAPQRTGNRPGAWPVRFQRIYDPNGCTSGILLPRLRSRFPRLRQKQEATSYPQHRRASRCPGRLDANNGPFLSSTPGQLHGLSNHRQSRFTLSRTHSESDFGQPHDGPKSTHHPSRSRTLAARYSLRTSSLSTCHVT